MSFLAEYIKTENPELEEILLDSEILSEIKSDKFVQSYIVKNFSSIIKFLFEEPNLINDSSKRIYNLPFIASEICLLNLKEINNRLLANIDNEVNYFNEFFSYVQKADRNQILNSNLANFSLKIIKKIIKTNFKEFLKYFSNDKLFDNLIECLAKIIFLDQAADVIILLHSNETENYSLFKNKISNRFSNVLSNKIQELNCIITSHFNRTDKVAFKIQFETSIDFDVIENIMKYFMKQMKVWTIIETDYKIREKLLSDVIFHDKCLENLQIHLEIISENWIYMYDNWEITRSVNSLIHYVTTCIIYLSNKTDFNNSKFEECINLFMFDEIMDLDIVQTNSINTDSSKFENNFLTSKTDAGKHISMLIDLFFKLCFNLAKIIISSSKINFEYILNFIDFILLLLLNKEIIHLILSIDCIEFIIDNFSKFKNNTFYMSKLCKLFDLIISNSKSNNNLSDNQNKSADCCIYSNLLKSDSLFNFINIIDLSNIVKKDKMNVEENNADFYIFNKESYKNQDSIHVFLILKQLYEIKEDIKIHNIKSYEILMTKEISYNSYKSFYEREITKEKQNPDVLKFIDPVLNTNNTSDIDGKIKFKFFSYKKKLLF